MNMLIIPNLGKRYSDECTREVVRRLNEYNCTCYMQTEYLTQFGEEKIQPFEPASQKEIIDAVISIGGDGTMIHSARCAVALDKPVVGINAGRLGFLTEIEYNDLDKLGDVVNQNYTIQQRMLIQATLHNREGIHTYQALNDIVISKGELAKVVDIEVEMKNGFVTSYRADGLIFSTPTGSTAYALSAGGPIVYDAIDTIIVTPICPHSLFSRAILYSPEEMFRVKGRYVNNSEILYMTVDGENGVKVEPEDTIIIEKAPRMAKFISFGATNYYEKLNKKILGRS